MGFLFYFLSRFFFFFFSIYLSIYLYLSIDISICSGGEKLLSPSILAAITPWLAFVAAEDSKLVLLLLLLLLLLHPNIWSYQMIGVRAPHLTLFVVKVPY